MIAATAVDLSLSDQADSSLPGSGMTPRQNSSGGEERLGSPCWVMRAIDGHATKRGFALLERDPTRGAVVALANKIPVSCGQ